MLIGEGADFAGILRYENIGQRQASVFEYDADWIARGFALDPPSLPLLPGPQFTKRVFHSAIADTAPDGWGKKVIMRDHAKRRNNARKAGEKVEPRPLNELDYLLAVDDQSRMGAIRLRDENGVFQRTPEVGERTAPPLIELSRLVAASQAIEKDDETEADLRFLRGKGTSLGGLRPKCTVVDDYGRLSIGKFPSVKDQTAVTRGEVLAMKLATAAGIHAAEASIVLSDDLPITLVRRFDREEGGGRLMYISAATMLGASADEEHSYTEIVDALRQHGAAPQQDIEELWRRIAFSILITNVDDHLHNHGFIHADSGQWRLSPAFDINPFPERARELKTWISEETGPEATIAAIVRIAAYCRISARRVREILQAVERAVAGWQEAGRALGMSNRDLQDLTPAFEHEERAAARRAIAG